MGCNKSQVALDGNAKEGQGYFVNRDPGPKLRNATSIVEVILIRPVV